MSVIATTPNGSASPYADQSRYKWVALSTVTLGTLMVFINQSIVLISLPDIFRGIGLNPLTPGNTGYLLWMLLGFMVVLAVLLVTLGRVGDMFGRVRVFNLGFAVFTFFSILLSITWLSGASGAWWLILMRVGQGVGGAMLFANSSAIVTDAFPTHQRGLGLGINNVAAISGGFIGLVLGGLLAPVQWHLVFLISVPFGLFGTIWAYLKLEDRGIRTKATIDWWGNVTFAAGLILILVGITYGLLPYGGHTMGWSSPVVLSELLGGVLVLIVFGVIETKVADPMFRLTLFRIRAFTAGNVASFLASLSRGGLMFMLIIWLQGIWLPLHGYSFSQTPLWAGIYMIPLTVGFLLAGPLSGILADRYGARPFATGGLLVVALSFVLLQMLPVDFSYWGFAALIFMNSVGMGMFIAPNQAGIMNSLPANQRGAGAGMSGTFNSSAQVLSIGIFFTLMILGLAATLPSALYHGLTAQGVGAATALRVSHLPPVGSLFAAFLGYNPIQTLLGPGVLSHLSPATAHYLTGRSFFPHLISSPFGRGLTEAFYFAAGACGLGAVASLLRGGKYHYQEPGAVTANGHDPLAVPAAEAVAETEPLLVD
ncbi:MAG TPA: MFS transporter [Acidimicrobiales bacterium]|jgi:MFS family permease|nr:MFS transporter [Acidimicrobiales bacterium]